MSPDELLALRFTLDARGRIIGTNEPRPERGPRLAMIRTASALAWAVRDDVSDEIAAREPERARELLDGSVDEGPTFSFPDAPASAAVTEIDSLAPLVRHLRGWHADEIAGCRPILAICDGVDAISICFCARRSATAAEAGVYTSEAHRGRGYAAIVTTAWAAAIRASGRSPVYSTSWSNTASLAVAHKLGLVQYATQLNIVD